MQKHPYLILVMLAGLAGCGSVDRDGATALGDAGQDAAQALRDQVEGTRRAVASVPAWTVVREDLNCARTAPELHQACLDGAAAQRHGPAYAQIKDATDRLSTLLRKRAAAAQQLRLAYAAFARLGRYDAGAEAAKAIGSSFGALNDLTSTMTSLFPAAAPVAALGEPVSAKLAKAAGMLADHEQRDAINDASRDLRQASQTLLAALQVERDLAATRMVMGAVRSEKEALFRAYVAAGLVTPTLALEPILAELAPGVRTVAEPPAAQNEVITRAATDWVTLRAQREDDAAAASYQQAIDTLAALVAEHLRLENGEPLDLAAIATRSQALRALTTELNPPPQR